MWTKEGVGTPFPREEREAQRGTLACSRSQSWLAAELGLEIRHP